MVTYRKAESDVSTVSNKEPLVSTQTLTYNDMRIFADHALRNWLTRHKLAKEPFGALNRTTQNENTEYSDTNNVVATHINVSEWVHQLDEESPEYPRGERFPLRDLTDQEVLFLRRNLEGHTAQEYFNQLANQREIQMGLGDEDPRVPDHLMDKPRYKVNPSIK